MYAHGLRHMANIFYDKLKCLSSVASNVYLVKLWLGIQLTLGGFADSHPIPQPPIHGRVRYSFLIMLNPMAELTPLVVGIKPGDAGVVIGYQVDELTLTWLVKFFVT